MAIYVVRDKMHQCCEIEAASVAVDKDNGDLVFYSEALLEIARVAVGWAGYAIKEAMIGYRVTVVENG